MTDQITKPERETSEAVYSNIDHVLDEEVVAKLEADRGLFAQHAAWNFCGYVWRTDDGWVEEVWVYKSLVEVFHGEEIQDVIDKANDEYGHR